MTKNPRVWASLGRHTDDPEDVWRRRPQGHRELSEVLAFDTLAGRNLGMVARPFKNRGYEQRHGTVQHASSLNRGSRFA